MLNEQSTDDLVFYVIKMDLNSSLNFKSLKIDLNTCNDEEIIIGLNKTSKASNHMVSLNNTVKIHKEIYIYTNLSICIIKLPTDIAAVSYFEQGG